MFLAMTITTISKHLPAAKRFLYSPAGPRVLNLIHLVESARSHRIRFEELASGVGQAPDCFESGLEIEKRELDHHYRFMAAFFELESFFLAAKRFLDYSWCCIGEPFGKGAEQIRTLPKAIFKMKASVKCADDIQALQSSKFYTALETAYKDWGEKTVRIRNYIEHAAPFGGLAGGYQITVADGKQSFDPFIPDVVPDKTQPISKEQLTYDSKQSFTTYVVATMENLDQLLETLLEIDEPLIFKKT